MNSNRLRSLARLYMRRLKQLSYRGFAMTLTDIIVILRFIFPTLRILLPIFILLGCGPDPNGATEGSEENVAAPVPHQLKSFMQKNSSLVLDVQVSIEGPEERGPGSLVNLSVDPEEKRFTGRIEELSPGEYTFHFSYSINDVQVATASVPVTIVAGQNTNVIIPPESIRYIEAVADALFVSDIGNNTIHIFDQYSRLSGGTVAASPSRIIQGGNTTINRPLVGSLFVDSIHGRIYMTNSANNAVAVWNNAADVNGNVPPDRILTGSDTNLSTPTGIYVDPFRDTLYVANLAGAINIWSRASTVNGNTPPTATISGPSTSLGSNIYQIYLLANTDSLYVSNYENILVFQGVSTLVGPQDIRPDRAIALSETPLQTAGLAVDPESDVLYLSSADPTGSIYSIAEASAATGPVLPAIILSGPATGLSRSKTLYYANNTLMQLNEDATSVLAWHDTGELVMNATPTQRLTHTGPVSLTGLFYVSSFNTRTPSETKTLSITVSGSGSVTSDVPGINCPTNCDGEFPAGVSVTLTAAPLSGHVFSGWSGGCSGTDPCIVNMNESKNVTAHFGLDTRVLTVNVEGGGKVVSSVHGIACPSSCGASFPVGTSVTLTAVVPVGSSLTVRGWTGNCSESIPGATCTVIMNANQAVTARFSGLIVR